MQLIKNNPYRTVGILIDASAREQERQVRRLKQFLEAEQTPQDDYSFPKLGNLTRTTEIVAEAASKLNLDSDKITAALFWFYNGNAITDEPALELLKEGNIKEAVNIWGKISQDKEITKKNASAFFNWSNLLLNASINGTSIREDYLEKGISLKLQFLESEFMEDFQKAATDETFRISKKELQLIFLNQIQNELGSNSEQLIDKFLEILNKQEFAAKADFIKGFVQGPIKQIESLIAETKAKRKDNPRDAEIYGKELFEEAEEQLAQLRNILGTSDIGYKSLADKLSGEILQCGIDFFKELKDEDFDPSDDSMELFEIANSLAVGNIAKQRCQENIENLQEWIDEKPDRERFEKIGAEIVAITSKLERFQNLNDTLANAQEFIESCKPYLVKIKSALGASDEFYINICNGVVSNAQGMIVEVVNSVQSKSAYNTVLATIGTAFKLIGILSKFDMGPNLRNQVKQNTDTISKIRNGFVDDLKLSLSHANYEMSKIQEWQFMRSEHEKRNQVASQQGKIDHLQSLLNKVL